MRRFACGERDSLKPPGSSGLTPSQEGDEEKINHRIPHRFQTLTNVSANWCCHCGYMLPLGRKNAKKCSGGSFSRYLLPTRLLG
jgi:hypothetical protein